MEVNKLLLWQSFLKGDRRSLESIYNEHYEMLYEYGFRLVKNSDWVRDCIQDLFVKLWSNRANINENVNIRFYLFKALKNQLLNYSLAYQKRSTVPLLGEDSFLLAYREDESVLLKGHQEEQTEKLIRALNQLTGRQKEIIYLKYFAELDNQEVAELMDLSVRAVYKLTYRALEALRSLLDVSGKELLLLLLANRALLQIFRH